MHDTAMKHGKLFFSVYPDTSRGLKIVDLGAQDVSGSLRSFARPTDEYIGVDFVTGRGVDVVIDDPYKLPFEAESIDVVVCSSCFEHSEFFWETFIEILRVLKPAGLLYLNVPSNGSFHRYPVDCWRFYPDSGRALKHWANRQGYTPALLESFIGSQSLDGWNDFVAVFVKDERNAGVYPERMQTRLQGDYSNGLVHGCEEFSRYNFFTEDQRQGPFKRLSFSSLKAARSIKRILFN